MVGQVAMQDVLTAGELTLRVLTLADAPELHAIFEWQAHNFIRANAPRA